MLQFSENPCKIGNWRNLRTPRTVRGRCGSDRIARTLNCDFRTLFFELEPASLVDDIVQRHPANESDCVVE